MRHYDEGFCDDKTVGMKHAAIRDSGRDSTFKPNVANLAPRKAGWKPTPSNTQKPDRE